MRGIGEIPLSSIPPIKHDKPSFALRVRDIPVPCMHCDYVTQFSLLNIKYINPDKYICGNCRPKAEKDAKQEIQAAMLATYKRKLAIKAKQK